MASDETMLLVREVIDRLRRIEAQLRKARDNYPLSAFTSGFTEGTQNGMNIALGHIEELIAQLED